MQPAMSMARFGAGGPNGADADLLVVGAGRRVEIASFAGCAR